MNREDSPESLPKGFSCECGEFHRFSAWVYAHWDEALTFQCPLCGAKYDVLRGYVMQVKGSVVR